MAGLPSVVVVMGVSGSGKSTVGALLAERLHCSFHDADDYHPAHNIEKMKRGEPLTDADRSPWLEKLHQLLRSRVDRGERAVLACSALKDSYRQVLRGSLPATSVGFVLLAPSRAELMARVNKRVQDGSHFMPPALLDSQLSTLEVQHSAVLVTFSDEQGVCFPSAVEIVEQLVAMGG